MRRIPSATLTSARRTSTPVGRWTPGSWATASPGPAEAFKYAQGETIKHPIGYDIKIDTPMDFMGVTDHSEYVGVTKEANTPGSGGEQDARSAAADHEGPEQPAEQEKVFSYLLTLDSSSPPIKAFMTPK